MRLTRVEVQERPDGVRLVGHVTRRDGSAFELYFAYPAEYARYLNVSADPFMTGLLTVSMKDGEPLEADVPVSDRLAFNLPRVRDIFHAWFAGFCHIPIRVAGAGAGAASPDDRLNQAASFYSGGVDSLHALLKRRQVDPLPAPLTHVIFMRGVETKLERSKDVDAAIGWARQVADRAGVDCAVGETNLRSVARVHWEHFQFGSGLAAVASSLGRGFRFVCIPSSYGYGHMEPHGSTPLVDEMYGSETLTIVHDGAEATRSQKVARCLEWNRSLTLSSLRVCTENDGSGFNCCRCYKCVRTAVALHALGALPDAVTFPDKSREHWPAVMEDDHLGMLEDNLDLLRETQRDPQLCKVLEQIVARKRKRQALKAYVAANPPLHRLVSRLRPRRRKARAGR